MSLCDALDCVLLYNEGLHRRLLSLRGHLVLPMLLGVPILVSLSVVWLQLKIFVTFTHYFPSRVLMTLVSVSGMHAGATHVFEFCCSVFLSEDS